MKNLMKITIATITLLTALINFGYGQLPVIDVIESYSSDYPIATKNGEDPNGVNKTIPDVKSMNVVFFRYLDAPGMVELNMSFSDNTNVSIMALLLYPIEQVKRGNLYVSHYMSRGLTDFAGDYLIVTIKTNDQDRIEQLEIALVGSKEIIVVRELQLVSTQDSF